MNLLGGGIFMKMVGDLNLNLNAQFVFTFQIWIVMIDGARANKWERETSFFETCIFVFNVKEEIKV